MGENNQSTSLTKAEQLDQEYPIDKYNRVFPTTSILNSVIPYHQVSIDILKLSSNPDDGEVFKLAMKKVDNKWEDVLSLTKLSLEKIANLLKVEWLPELSGRVDDRKDPRIIEFRAVGRIRNLGSLKKDDYTVLSATKQVDLNAIENEQRFILEEKAEAGKLKYNNKEMKNGTAECEHAIERLVKKRMIEVDKHKLALAESGAKNRAIRGFGIKSTYTKNQLDMPFAVHNIHIDHDAINKDPEAKKLLMSSAFGAEKLLYNSGSDNEPIQEAEVVDTEPKPEETKTEEKSPEPDAATKRIYQEAEFKSFDFETRFESVEKMLEKHDVQVNGAPLVITKEAFKKRTPEKQIEALMWIYDENHKDDKAEIEDNIPV